MKNKKQMYFLVPAVALVWGLITYKIINGTSPEYPTYQQIGKVKTSSVAATKTNEAYTLTLNYDDPFGNLSKPGADKSVRSKSKITKKQIVKVEEPKIDLSKYKYQGMIQNATSKDKIALVMVNNEMKMIKEGDHIDKYQITKIKKDSIQIRWNRKTVYLRASR